MKNSYFCRFFAVVFCLFSTSILAKLPETPGLSVLDAATGASGNSPMSAAIFSTERHRLVLEAGASAYYDAPIFDDDERLSNFFCGATFMPNKSRNQNALQNRFSLSVSSLNAFDLYSETDISASYGITPLRLLHFGAGVNYLVLRSEGDAISGAGLSAAAGVGTDLIAGFFSYSARNIGDGEYNPAVQEIKAVIRLKENRFGSQAAIFKIDDFTRRISAELAYNISFYEVVNLGVSFVPKPFVVKIGLVFNIRQTRTFAAFTFHNVLGMSRHLGVQYLQNSPQARP